MGCMLWGLLRKLTALERQSAICLFWSVPLWCNSIPCPAGFLASSSQFHQTVLRFRRSQGTLTQYHIKLQLLFLSNAFLVAKYDISNYILMTFPHRTYIMYVFVYPYWTSYFLDMELKKNGNGTKKTITSRCNVPLHRGTCYLDSLIIPICTGNSTFTLPTYCH